MIDIVIVNYNSTRYLLNCLDSIQKSIGEIPVKIYVEDNASNDGVESIKKEFPEVELNVNRQNTGFAGGVNRGVQRGNNPYVILLNPDTFVMPPFFDNCYRFMIKNPDVAIMGPRIYDHDGCLQNSARGFPTPLTAFFGRSSFLSRKFPRNPITSRNLLSLKSDGKTPMEVDWVSGACMVVRRSAIDEVGLLDERFFMYWEDADWCMRMRESGWKVIYYPQTSIYHYIGGSSEKKIIRSVYEFHKSVYILFEKYFPSPFSYLKPVVFCGLGLRVFLVLATQFFQRGFSTVSSRKKDGNDTQTDTSPEKTGERKIKVLRVISRMNIGGPSIHVHILNKGLNPEIFDSKLVIGSISSHEGDMKYLFENQKKKPIVVAELQREINLRKDLKAFLNIYSILEREKPDIVHTHTAKAGSISRFAVLLHRMKNKRPIKVFHTFHGHIFEGYFIKFNEYLFINIERFLAKLSHRIIAISQTQKKELSFKYRIAPPEKIETIELGFDLTPFFACNNKIGELRSSLNISKDTYLIGIIGRLVPIKNHLMFFMAAKKLLDKRPGDKIKFLVVGDGELRRELEMFCSKNGFRQQIVFCGWQKDVTRVYADLDVLALTSLNEGTPVSIIESMAAGVPVISTDAGGVTDLMGNVMKTACDNFQVCERGILCKKNDPEGFANGMDYILSADCREMEIRIVNARNFVNKRFDRKRLIKDIEKLYLENMKSTPPDSFL